MDYYLKYIKYKSKYLNLSSNNYNMSGSGKPSCMHLKDINLFPNQNLESDIEQHLNPIFGFIWNEFGAITNYYNFKDNNKLCRLIGNTFYKLDGLIQPSKKIIIHFTPRDLGILLGCRYICKQVNKKIKQITYYIECIDKMESDYTNIEELKKNIRINYIEIEDVIPTKKNLLLKFLKKYINTLDDYKKSLITKSNNNANPIVKEFIRKKITNILNDTNEDIELFHIILAIVWYISNNKSGIKDYYLGINYILPSELQVTIPENFTTNIFSIESFNKYDSNTNYFNFILAKTYYLKNGPIKLYNQEYSNVNSTINYPDCGESALRTFINILTFDKKTELFDIKRLKKFKPNDKITEYYTIFNNDKLQSSLLTKNIFNKELNARDAWSLIVSNLEGVTYNTITIDGNNTFELDKYTLGLDGYKYNIKSGLSKKKDDDVYIVNLLQVLRKLFLKITNFTDFNNKNIKIDVELDRDGFGKIKIITKHSGNYIMRFINGHYSIDSEINIVNLKMDVGKLTKKELYYIKLLSTEIEEIKYEDFILEQKNWYYFYKYTSTELIYLFNKYEINKNDYNLIFDYMYNNYNDDEKRRIFIDLNKFDNISKYNLEKYGNNVKYDDSGNKNFENIIEYLSINKNYNKLINLQSLTLGNSFNEELETSLDNLTNLKSLTFGDKFNKELGTSLNNLTNLRSLNLAEYMEPVYKSLDKLINLETLIFGFSQYEQIYNSLDNLTNLRSLDLGNYLEPVKKSLDNLTNLQSLILGYYVNEPLNNSLKKLINLQSLDLGNIYNRPLNDSLDKLTNLRSLQFGKGFTQPLNESLNLLTNLNSLIFKNDYTELLGTSLDKLINLESLQFGYSVNKSFGTSLNKLKNLKSIKFVYKNETTDEHKLPSDDDDDDDDDDSVPSDSDDDSVPSDSDDD